MPQLKAAQELLFMSNDDPPERGNNLRTKEAT